MAIKLKSNIPSPVINKQRESILNKEITWFSNKISDKRKEQFFHSMSILVNQKVSISKSLETVIEEQKLDKDKALFKEILAFIIDGNSFSEALKLSGKFDNYECYSINIGEETGKLGYVLEDIHQYFNQKIEQKRKLIAALSYPVVVLIVAALTVTFMLSVIVPLFADIFNRFDSELPFVTKTILNLSNFIKDRFWYILLGILALILMNYFLNKQEKFRRLKQQLLIKLPLIGGVIHKTYLYRFCNTMALLSSANIPLLDSLGLVKQMINFYPFEDACVELKNKLLLGQTLHQGMKTNSMFPPKVSSMVKIGEEVNQLDVMFSKLSEVYREDLNYQIQLFNSVLEPLLIVFLGIIVGVILIAMYLPIFQLSTQMF